MTLSCDEFIRRFLLHTLPRGFQRFRYYGLLACCHRADKLQLCRQLLLVPIADLLPQPTDCRQYYAMLTGHDPRLCPRCGIGAGSLGSGLAEAGPRGRDHGTVCR